MGLRRTDARGCVRERKESNTPPSPPILCTRLLPRHPTHCHLLALGLVICHPPFGRRRAEKLSKPAFPEGGGSHPQGDRPREAPRLLSSEALCQGHSEIVVAPVPPGPPAGRVTSASPKPHPSVHQPCWPQRNNCLETEMRMPHSRGPIRSHQCPSRDATPRLQLQPPCSSGWWEPLEQHSPEPRLSLPLISAGAGSNGCSPHSSQPKRTSDAAQTHPGCCSAPC